MAREPDWKALANKLAKPWWGPNPGSYTFTHRGRKAGVGLIVEQDYGHWNLMLLEKGNYHNPQTVDEHGRLVEMLVRTRIAYGDVWIGGGNLASYTMLMDVMEFATWVGKSLKGPLVPHLQAGCRTLLENVKHV